jgi:hypothetical protein
MGRNEKPEKLAQVSVVDVPGLRMRMASIRIRWKEFVIEPFSGFSSLSSRLVPQDMGCITFFKWSGFGEIADFLAEVQ